MGWRLSFDRAPACLHAALVRGTRTWRAYRALVQVRGVRSNVGGKMGAWDEYSAIGSVRTGRSWSVVPTGFGRCPRAKARRLESGGAGRAGPRNAAAGFKDDRRWKEGGAEGHAGRRDRLRCHKDRSYRAGHLQSAERIFAGLLQRHPAGAAAHAIAGLSHMEGIATGSDVAAILRDISLWRALQDEVLFCGEILDPHGEEPAKRASRTMRPCTFAAYAIALHAMGRPCGRP